MEAVSRNFRIQSENIKGDRDSPDEDGERAKGGSRTRTSGPSRHFADDRCSFVSGPSASMNPY